MVEQRPDRLAAIEQTMESFQGVLNSMMTTLSAVKTTFVYLTSEKDFTD